MSIQSPIRPVSADRAVRLPENDRPPRIPGALVWTGLVTASLVAWSAVAVGAGWMLGAF